MRAALGLGASLGPRRATLERTVRQLDAHPDVDVLRTSRWVRTPPMPGGSARGWFLNGVALLEVGLGPAALLELCVTLEAAAGRRRARFWGDRPLDLDVLLLEGTVIDTPRLQVPHPAVAERRFVLEPLLEIWPDAIDPRTGEPLASAAPAPGIRPVPVGVVARRQALRYL